MNYSIGYFSTSQQEIYGKNKVGHIIYKINTFNNINKHYLVSYGGKLKGKIIIIFISNNLNDPPEGNIIDVIGLMNESNLLKTIQYIHKINRNNLYNLIKNIKLNNYNNYISLINKNIFSIDPINCEDIDDALSIDYNEKFYIISVYIAQPINWLNDDIIKHRLINSFSTLYNQPYNKNDNLWGDKVTELASLNINEQKPAHIINYYINKNTLNIDKIEDYSDLIINKIKTNYIDCLKYPDINELYNLTKQLIKKNIDTYELVSYWMIKTNNYIGNKYKYLNIPFRVIKYNNNDIYHINDLNIKDIFINKMCNSAHYSLTENYHYKLDLYDYVHFTSPIRRIIDTLIQYCIKYNYNFNDLLNKYNSNINIINENDKNTRKYHNNINLLNNINNINWTNDESELDGWIYKININKYKITIYFQEIGFQSIKIVNNKFQNNKLINIEYQKIIDNIQIGNKYKFVIYKKNGFLPFDKIHIIFKDFII